MQSPLAVVEGQEIDPSVEQPFGTETTALPSAPPTRFFGQQYPEKPNFSILSGKTLLLIIFFWPWIFISICFALFFGFHSNYYYTLEGQDQVPTISVSGSRSPSSILFAYGLHFEAAFLAIFFIVLYHLYTEKIDSFYNTDRVAAGEYDPEEAVRQETAPQIYTRQPESAMNIAMPAPLPEDHTIRTPIVPQEQQQRRERQIVQCEEWYRYWINACECCTCYGCRFFQCACCYCDYLAFDDHFQHTNASRYPQLRSYLHHWNRVCLGMGLFAALCMTMVGSINLNVQSTAHSVFAFLMFAGGVGHEVFFFYHVTRHVGSVQRHSLFPIFCHQVCLVVTLPFNILIIIIIGIIYYSCGSACQSFVSNMFPALEFTTILFVLLYVFSFYDEFSRVAVVTTVNHHWQHT